MTSDFSSQEKLLCASAGYVQELTVFIAEKLTSSPGIQYRRCVQGVSRISGSKLRIECQSEEDAAPVPGRFLHIRDERKIHDFYFALCEIEIYQGETILTHDHSGHGPLFLQSFVHHQRSR